MVSDEAIYVLSAALESQHFWRRWEWKKMK